MVKPLIKPHFWGSTLGGVGWLAMIRLWFKRSVDSERIGAYMAFLRKSRVVKNKTHMKQSTLPINLFLKVLHERDDQAPPQNWKTSVRIWTQPFWVLSKGSRMWVWFTNGWNLVILKIQDLKTSPHPPRDFHDQILSGEEDDPTRIRFP